MLSIVITIQLAHIKKLYIVCECLCFGFAINIDLKQ